MRKQVLSFTPQAELQPSANLAVFIELCRTSEVLGANRQFHKNTWKVGYRKGNNKIVRLVFSTLEATADHRREPSFPHPFLNFAKATLVYLQDKRPVQSQSARMSALRCLEAALRDLNKGSRPTAVNEMVLDSAVEFAKKQVSLATAYAIGGALECVADFMRSKGFITLRQRWTHGIKRPLSGESRISKEALTARQEKLPSAATLRALGSIFSEARDPTDVLVSSFTALMLCAPERINEVLQLRRNCLVEGEGEYRGKLGLRWSGSKGFENTTKWLPTEMAPIARQAIRNIIRTTAAAQELASWYIANPTELYLHAGAQHLKSREVLTTSEIALLLWGDQGCRKAANLWAQTTNKLPKVELKGRNGFLFKDVERAVIAMLPSTFPSVTGSPRLLCKDAMAIMRTNEMHAARATYLCMFTYVDYSTVYGHYGTPKDRKSIFERFSYVEDDGSPIKLQSHSLRHYLNMLAQTGGLSSTEIAIFSGRKDVKQNRAYDHMTSDEVQAPVSQALKNGFTAELEPLSSERRNLVTRREFRGLGLPAAHTTEYGYCLHDFASEPCQMYRDCVNCEEQECIKGERQKEANLLILKSETEYLLRQALGAMGEEEYGADTWVKHQTSTLERVNALLSILEDPAVPDGARIKLGIANAPLITAEGVGPVKVVKNMRRKALP